MWLGDPFGGGFCDLTSFKTTLVMLFGLMSFALLTLPAFTFLSHYMYFVLLCVLFFCFGGLAVTLPTGVARLYGLEYAAVNYGLLYVGSIIASIFIASAVILLRRPGLNIGLDWEGLVCISGGSSYWDSHLCWLSRRRNLYSYQKSNTDHVAASCYFITCGCILLFLTCG